MEPATSGTVKTTKRMVCWHGADNYLKMETTRTDSGHTVKATERICKVCMEELALNIILRRGQETKEAR